jgi:hypothetical protein
MIDINDKLRVEASGAVISVKSMAADLSNEEHLRHDRQILMIAYTLEKIARYAEINEGREIPRDDDTAVKHNMDWISYTARSKKYLKDIYTLLDKRGQTAWATEYKSITDLLVNFRAFLVSRVPKE